MSSNWNILNRLATSIAATETEDQDRYGDPCQLNIDAIRIGEIVFLIVPLFEKDFDLHGPFPLKDLERRAREIHSQYDFDQYGNLSLWESGEGLEDRQDVICAILDRAHRPDIRIKSVPPSEILCAIAKGGRSYGWGVWAWINQTVYLSAFRLQRIGMLSAKNVYDDSLAKIIRGFGINVSFLKVSPKSPDESWTTAVVRAEQVRRRGNTEQRLNKVTRRLEKLRLEANDAQRDLEQLEAELRSFDNEK